MNKMETKMRNSKYTQEFRDETVQLALAGEKSVLGIARDLDINPKTLYNWIRQYKIKNNIPINPPGTKTVQPQYKETLEEELKRLRKENRILKQERDILKKATAYFAKEVG